MNDAQRQGEATPTLSPAAIRVMLLAAGRGERMRELTLDRPKPMLNVGGQPLLEHALQRILAAGYRDITINVAWKAEVITEWLAQWPATPPQVSSSEPIQIRVSHEPEGALETAGGILRALYQDGAMLAAAEARRKVMLAVNADVLCDARLAPPTLADDDLGHLLLVPNPAHHPSGDFGLVDGRVLARAPAIAGRADAACAAHPDEAANTYTFSGIGWYRGELFAGLEPGRAALGPLLKQAARDGRLSGQVHRGLWLDVGTPERLAEANTRFRGLTETSTG